MQGPYHQTHPNNGAANPHHPITTIIGNKENLSQTSSDANANRSQGPPVDLVIGDGMIDHMMLGGLSTRGGEIAAPGDQREERKLAGNKRPLAGVVNDNDWYISGSGASSDSSDVEGQGIYPPASAASQDGNKRQATASSRGMGVAGTLALSMKAPRISGGDGSGDANGVEVSHQSTHDFQRTHPSSSPPPPPPVTCLRLIVLDITDDPQRRIKDLTCFISDNTNGMTTHHTGGSDSTTANIHASSSNPTSFSSNQQSQPQPQQQQPKQQQQHNHTMNSARVVSSNMVVRVTGDWYHASIHGGYPLPSSCRNKPSHLITLPHPITLSYSLSCHTPPRIVHSSLSLILHSLKVYRLIYTLSYNLSSCTRS